MIAAGLPFPDISPDIFSIEIGALTLTLRWYALAYIVGLLLGWRLCIELIRRTKYWPDQKQTMTSQQLESFLNWVIFGIILGGRLGFVLFYQPGYYLSQPLEILKIWQGGMSFHGGFLGVSIAAVVFAVRNQISIMSLADLLALSAPLGLFLGRLANFINAELWGRPTTLPWGVIFPGDAAQSCADIIGQCARHPSQIYEALLEGLLLGVALMILALRRKWLHSPGAITGVFLTGYGSARFLVEFFRQPDMQFVTLENPVGHALHFAVGGLTMGQILSLPMVLVGAVLIWVARSRRGPIYSGKQIEMD